MTLFDVIEPIFVTFFNSFYAYLPNFVGGLIILAIGIVLSQIIGQIVKTFSNFFRLEKIFKQAKIGKDQDIKIWGDIISEIIKWAVIILFLIPASEVWGLTKVSDVLRQLLFYIPSVIVAVIIGFVGLLFANLAYDVVRHSIKNLDSGSAKTLSSLAKYAIVFFTGLVVLDQLGVARELIRILFTGIVVMISLAGGLAFGLGGKDLAKDILDKIIKKA